MGALCGAMETSVCREQCFFTVFLFFFLSLLSPRSLFRYSFPNCLPAYEMSMP